MAQDQASMDVDAGFRASVSVQLGETARAAQAAQTSADRAARAALAPPAQPVSTKLIANGVAVTATDLVLAFGGPQEGRFWYVRRAVAGGVTWATSAAGTALLVVDAMPPVNAAAVGIGSVYDEAASLPLPAFYGRGEIPLRYPEQVFIIVQGGTNAQLYVGQVGIEEYQEAARVQTAGE